MNKPDLTAATTAARALLAADWIYDSTSPMADDTTIRTLLHPSGREIHARTVDRDGDTTSLTMTGLSLEQVAGAITGAGLAEPATVDLSYAGVNHILAALADAGLTAYDNDTDGHTYVEVWLTDLSLEHGPTILSWREPSGWRVQTFAKPEDYGDNKPARSWPITPGSLTEVARDVTTVLGTTSAGTAEQPEPATLGGQVAFQRELRRLADDIVEHNLPVPTYSLRVGGCVDSRADAQAWADFLGVEIKMGGSASNIPVAEKDIKLGDGQYLNLAFQAPSETHPVDAEKQRLLERVAELEAKLARDGDR